MNLAIPIPSGHKLRPVHVELPAPSPSSSWRLFDPIVTNAARLRILTALAASATGTEDFVRLRFRTQLTDGNLTTHARRLTIAGLVSVEKTFRDGKPVTRLSITPHGREALQAHVAALMAAMTQADEASEPAAPEIDDALEADDWVD